MTNMYLKPKEVAKELRVTKITVLKWIKSGKLHAIKLSENNFRIRKEDVDTFVKNMMDKDL